ncbi:MAG: HrcA family transcriptional regulator [Deltaproteobacteria bacterium]
MPRVADQDKRKKEILLAAIELYLTQAEPVSSDILRKMRRLDVSSATVRNVLAELEELGLLSHPHTSAGRVPTDEGYRYYLNALMQKKKLNAEEIGLIDKIFSMKVREIDDLLEETSRILSDFTHYASLVSLQVDDDQRVHMEGLRHLLEHPEFQDLQRARRIMEALETREVLFDLIDRQFVGKTRVYVGKECKYAPMESCAVVVTRCGGSEKRAGKLAVIGPKRMAYDQVIPLLDYLAEAVAEHIERL